MRQLGVSAFLLSSSGLGRFYLDILLLVEDEIVLVARHERRSLLLQQMHSYLLIVILVSVYKAVKGLYGQLILLGLLDGKVVLLLVSREVGNLCRGNRHQLVARVFWRLIVYLKVNKTVHRPSLGWFIFILFFFIFILCERKPLAGLDDAHETKVLDLLKSWLGHL